MTCNNGTGILEADEQLQLHQVQEGLLWTACMSHGGYSWPVEYADA